MGTKTDLLKKLLSIFAICASLLYCGYLASRICLADGDNPNDSSSGGYLLEAKRHRSDFLRSLDSPQSVGLSAAFALKGYPVESWAHFLGPPGFRYYEKVGRIGPEFFPGTSYILAALPPGHSIGALNFAVLITLLALCGGLALAEACKGKFPESGFFGFLALAGFLVISEMPNQSLAVNAVLPPLFLTAWFFSRRQPLAAGASFGVAALIHPLMLLAFPVLISRKLKTDLKLFAVVFFVGILPLLYWSWTWRGAFELGGFIGFTDSAKTFIRHFGKMIGMDAGGWVNDNCLIYVVALSAFAICISRRKGFGECCRILFLGWALPLVLLTFKPKAFFFDATPFAWFAASLVAFYVADVEGFRKIEAASDTYLRFLSDASSKRVGLIGTLPFWMMVAWMPALFRLDLPFVDLLFLKSDNWVASKHVPLLPEDFPAAFTQEKTWIWTDSQSGVIWYFLGHPAFRLGEIDSAAMNSALKLAAMSGEEQYWVGLEQEPIYERLREDKEVSLVRLPVETRLGVRVYRLEMKLGAAR